MRVLEKRNDLATHRSKFTRTSLHSLLLARSGSGTDKSTCHVACGKSQDTASELTPLSTIPRTIGYLTYHMQISRACSGVYSTLRKTTLPAPPAISPSLTAVASTRIARWWLHARARSHNLTLRRRPPSQPFTCLTRRPPAMARATASATASARHTQVAIPRLSSHLCVAPAGGAACARATLLFGLPLPAPSGGIAIVQQHRSSITAGHPPLNPPPQRHTATLPQRRHRSAATAAPPPQRRHRSASLLTRTHAE